MEDIGSITILESSESLNLPRAFALADQSGLVTIRFFSVDFSQSRIGVTKCVFNKRTIKVCISYFWHCPGTSASIASHLTMSLFLCSSGSNAQGESRALEGRRVSSRGPSRVWDGDQGVAGRNIREPFSPEWGDIDLPSRQIIDFLPSWPTW